jgi:tetratricopeptide (TPR) repeat protein
LRAGRTEGCSELLATWQAAGSRCMPELEHLESECLPAQSLEIWRSLRGSQPVAGSAAFEPGPLPHLPGREPALRALMASAAPAVIVVGEPGIGKSTLLAAAFPAAAKLHGREALTGVPFAPILEWLRQHGLARVVNALHQAHTGLAAYRLDLARLLPELAPDEPLPALDAQTARARLLEALSRLFETTGPALVVDDLQWCDPATLDWLGYLAWRGRLRWIAGIRRSEQFEGPPGELVERLRAAHRLEEVFLPALSRAALGEACLGRWPRRPWSNAALDRLHRASGGNPFVLAQLVAMNADHELAVGLPVVLPRRAQSLVLRQLRKLQPLARTAVEAAAVLALPTAPALLREVAGCDDDAAFTAACEQAVQADLLSVSGAQLQCRHDLIRAAALSALGDLRGPWLHRRAAQALGAREPACEPMAVAAHWQAAQEPQLALAWVLRGAQQHRERGDFDAARALWLEVAEQSQDLALALRARLAIAACDLLTDLERGRSALETVLSTASAVTDPGQREQIEGRALAGLLDNAVFAGDRVRADALALRLQAMLPRLQLTDRTYACEVLIERAMRVPDIEGAWALQAQLEQLAPRWPVTLSMRAQVHWVQGDVRAARDGFEVLLATHPEHCGGLTIENDLAVMLHALGDLQRAERMARRSLESWRGLPHTEALSLRVLGSILTSAGREAEARAALDRALQLAREQSSDLLASDTLVRRAWLLLLCDAWADAEEDLAAAEALLRDSSEPLILSNFFFVRVLLDDATGRPPDAACVHRLRDLGRRSRHPLLHVRLALAEAVLALAGGDVGLALLQAQRQAEIARAAGLLEPLAEALVWKAELAARTAQDPAVHRPDALEALRLAEVQGFARLARRASAWLDAAPGVV